jgi:hypothetical protein
VKNETLLGELFLRLFPQDMHYGDTERNPGFLL